MDRLAVIENESWFGSLFEVHRSFETSGPHGRAGDGFPAASGLAG